MKRTICFWRAGMIMLFAVMTTFTARATAFIKDVKLIGGNKSETTELINKLKGEGWTFVDYDMNKGCGSESDYVYLLYKTEESPSGLNMGDFITDLYIHEGKEPPSSLTYDGRQYKRASCEGSEWFVSHYGDLNSNCGGSSAYIFLYYTKDFFPDNRALTKITIDDSATGAVVWDGIGEAADLNKGCGKDTPYIYMHFTTGTIKSAVVLTEETREVTLQDGDVLTGTGGVETHVSIADGATVTLRDVMIVASNYSEFGDGHHWGGLSCLGNATIVLADGTTNNIVGSRGTDPSINPGPPGTTLTIRGNGKLEGNSISGVSGDSFSSLSAAESLVGNIVIESGTLELHGYNQSSAIGSSRWGSCGDITIKGGNITATGGYYCAGIGAGRGGICGNISITGGVINASGDSEGAGIGSGSKGQCGNITLAKTVTRVTATAGGNNSYSIGAGVGGTCGTITLGNDQIDPITIRSFTYDPTSFQICTITFHSNNDEIDEVVTQKVIKGDTQLLKSNTFYPGHSLFTHWNTAADDSGISFDDNAQVVVGGDVDLYAQWTPGVVVTKDWEAMIVPGGYTLTGYCDRRGNGNTFFLDISDGASVTFKDLTILAYGGIYCQGDATITLVGSNKMENITGTCIEVPDGKTLTIRGSGSLQVKGYQSGIGGNACGNIIIESGNIDANGDYAGIGGITSSGDITIYGGNITASCNKRDSGGRGISGKTVTFKEGLERVYVTGGINNGCNGDEIKYIGDVAGVDYQTEDKNHNITYISEVYRCLNIYETSTDVSARLSKFVDGKQSFCKLNGRTLLVKGGRWNTLCLPFKLAGGERESYFGENCHLYQIDTQGDAMGGHRTGVEDGVVYLIFKELFDSDDTEPGMPYFIFWYNYDFSSSLPGNNKTANFACPTFQNVYIDDAAPKSITSEDGNLTFIGNYDYTEFTETDRSILFLSNGRNLAYPKPGARIPPCRSYFKLNNGLQASDNTRPHKDTGVPDDPDPSFPGLNPHENPPVPDVHIMVVDLGDGGETFVFNIKDGKTIFDNAPEEWYDLNGRKLDGKPTRSGVYINNGMKVIVK